MILSAINYLFPFILADLVVGLILIAFGLRRWYKHQLADAWFAVREFATQGAGAFGTYTEMAEAILILAFPWIWLPCLIGSAVNRAWFPNSFGLRFKDRPLSNADLQFPPIPSM